LSAPRGGKREVLRVGLVGCGGRGTGAAAQALRADGDTELVAMGDAFGDHLENSLGTLSRTADIAERVKVDDAHKFTGFDAFQKVVDASDVVLLATSPHFRPSHVEYAVEQGKHLFVEKPVATDAPGLRRIRAAARMAEEKGLSLVSGLCYRYQFAKRATIERIHGGMIGKVRTMQCTYNTGELWHRGQKPEWSAMEYQMRNWLYFTWLSGDHIAEQHIHSLDKLAWAMGDVYPIRATSTGGRSKRTDPKYGNIYDHFNTVYEWEDGTVGFSSCRQMSGCSSNVSDQVYGTEGVAQLQSHRIETDAGERWRYRLAPEDARHLRRGTNDDMYQNEHDALFWSIRAGEPINNGEYMCNSTMMAVIGRMAAYTGQTIKWEDAWNSTEDLAPPAYEWGPAPERPVAIPGVTKFS
jgi:myo-inositol 2-dehydrogenase / D-chiro-inositol 1-dehydrogenase